MTARDIEAISRLAEASARIRLSQHIDQSDVDRATRLFRHSRDESVGGDITTLHSGKKPVTRNREQSIFDIVQQIILSGATFASREAVLLEAERHDISSADAERIIDSLVNNGRLYRPGGYDNLGLV